MVVMLYIVGACALVAAGYGLIILLEKEATHDHHLSVEQIGRMQRYTQLGLAYENLTRLLGREPTIAELWAATPPGLPAISRDGTLLPLE